MTINDGFNNFSQLPMMQYNIISCLILNNEDIWKILKYNNPSCLSQQNLSQSDKASLIYQGQPDSTGYRVFMDSMQDDSFTDQCTILRVFPDIIIPKSRVLADITFRLEILSHTKLQYLDGYMNRNVYMLQQILATLNGQDSIQGVGLFSFDRMGSPYDKATFSMSNNRNYTGFALYMSTHTA